MLPSQKPKGVPSTIYVSWFTFYLLKQLIKANYYQLYMLKKRIVSLNVYNKK